MSPISPSRRDLARVLLKLVYLGSQALIGIPQRLLGLLPVGDIAGEHANRLVGAIGRRDGLMRARNQCVSPRSVSGYSMLFA